MELCHQAGSSWQRIWPVRTVCFVQCTPSPTLPASKLTILALSCCCDFLVIWGMITSLSEGRLPRGLASIPLRPCNT